MTNAKVAAFLNTLELTRRGDAQAVAAQGLYLKLHEEAVKRLFQSGAGSALPPSTSLPSGSRRHLALPSSL